MLEKQENSLMAQFQEQSIFSEQKKYDKILLEVLDMRNDLANKVAHIFVLLFAVPITLFSFLVFNSFWLSVMIPLVTYSLLWPVGLSFGDSEIGQNWWRVFFNKEYIKLRKLQKKEDAKYKDLKEIVLKQETKEFFSKLYIFLENTLKTESNHKTNNGQDTPLYKLFKKVKKIIETYMDKDTDYVAEEIIFYLSDTQEEIKKQLNKVININDFVTKNIVSDVKIIDETELFKKKNQNKYEY